MSNPKFNTPSARSSRDWASLEDAFPSDAPAATPPGDGDGTIVRGGGGGSGGCGSGCELCTRDMKCGIWNMEYVICDM